MLLYCQMKKRDIYLDTSIWNYLFADDVPDKKAKVMAVNLLEGYLKEMEFITPYEVLSDESG